MGVFSERGDNIKLTLFAKNCLRLIIKPAALCAEDNSWLDIVY
jgi:hypothetical protein